MNFSKLQTFITLSDCLSFTEAAEQLYCSQPAVSMQIQSLEKEIGMPLFDRIGKKLYLTKHGQHFKPYAEQIINLYHSAKEHVRQLDDLSFGTLSFGASNFVGAHLLPAVLGEFNSLSPGIKINMNITSSGALTAMLENNKVEFLIVSDHIPIDENRYHTRTFYQDELVLIVNPAHRLAHESDCTLAELADEMWVLKPHQSATRSYLEREFGRYGFWSPQRIEISNLEAIKQSVVHGLGISIVSSLAIRHEVQNGQLVVVPITGVSLLRGIRYAYHRSIHLSPAATRFLSLLDGMFGDE